MRLELRTELANRAVWSSISHHAAAVINGKAELTNWRPKVDKRQVVLKVFLDGTLSNRFIAMCLDC